MVALQDRTSNSSNRSGRDRSLADEEPPVPERYRRGEATTSIDQSCALQQGSVGGLQVTTEHGECARVEIQPVGHTETATGHSECLADGQTADRGRAVAEHHRGTGEIDGHIVGPAWQAAAAPVRGVMPGIVPPSARPGDGDVLNLRRKIQNLSAVDRRERAA